LRKLNPRLIYCSVTGYGQTGRKQRHPAYDPVTQAASGMMSFNGTPETAPVKLGPPIIDYGTGLSAALGLVIALYQRERTGIGQHVDISMLDAALTLMSSLVSDVLTAGRAPIASGNKNRSPENYSNGSFQCADRLLAIAAQEEHQRRNMWKAIGREDITLDPRFSTPQACEKNIDTLHAELETTLKTKTAREWEDILNESGVPAMAVRTLPEILQEDIVRERGFLHTFDKVEGIKGSVTVPLSPFKLGVGPSSAETPPPFLGQHTDELMKGLGYSEKHIAELRKAKVI